MEREKFVALTDRLGRELGISLAELARQVKVTPAHLSDCRAGRRRPNGTMIVALRAVAAGAPKLPEEG